MCVTVLNIGVSASLFSNSNNRVTRCLDNQLDGSRSSRSFSRLDGTAEKSFQFLGKPYFSWDELSLISFCARN